MTGRVGKYKLATGEVKWFYVYDRSPQADGRRRQIKKRGYATKKAADEALRQALAPQQSTDEDDHGTLAIQRVTVNDFLDQWLTEHVRRYLEPKTAERYADMMKYLRPMIGSLALLDLKPVVLQQMINRLHDSGGKDGSKLSARTVRNIATTFSSALNKAIVWDTEPTFLFNPMKKVKLPKLQRKKKKIVEAGEYQWLFESARGHPWLYALLVFDAATGARRGEALCLQWTDLDFRTKEVRIAKSLSQTRAGIFVKATKEDSEDVVSLPDHVIKVLEQHRQQQEKARKLLGADYRTELDLVFADADGDYLKPDSVTAKVSLLMKRCGLQGVSLHSLRHSHGSHLLNKGMSLPAVSRRLRHADPAITARIYSHEVSGDQGKAAQHWDQFMSEIGKERLTQ
jgi:integrase